MRFPESAFLMHIQKENATGGEDNPAPLFRGVRTHRYTYAVAEGGRWLLYDNREDPYQARNLIGESGYQKLAQDLDGVVLNSLKQAHDPFPYEAARRSARCSRNAVNPLDTHPRSALPDGAGYFSRSDKIDQATGDVISSPLDPRIFQVALKVMF